MNSQYAYWAIVVIVIMVLWLLVDYPVIGQLLISLYALFVFWRSIAGEQLIRLALVALGVTCVATLLQNLSASSAFSGYAFTLFTLGVFVVGKELWQHSVVLRRQKEEENAQ